MLSSDTKLLLLLHKIFLFLSIILCQHLALLAQPFYFSRILLSVIRCYISMETVSLAEIGLQ